MSSEGVGNVGFRGLRVLSLESRRAEVMEQLILHHGGEPWVAPSVKEIPFAQHGEVYLWAERLLSGGFDLVVLMTGVGLAFLRDIVAETYSSEAFVEALRRVTIVSRGDKPAAVLQEMGLTPQILVPEPNTWHEIVSIVSSRPERKIAVQEYGRANPEFVHALQNLGAEVYPLAIYRWALPDDTGPLREAIHRLAAGQCDVVLFTTSIQLSHLLELAEEMGLAAQVRQALREYVAIGSVGPVMDAALADHGFTPDIVPSHPKMPVLVRAAADSAHSVLARKRRVRV